MYVQGAIALLSTMYNPSAAPQDMRVQRYDRRYIRDVNPFIVSTARDPVDLLAVLDPPHGAPHVQQVILVRVGYRVHQRRVPKTNTPIVASGNNRPLLEGRELD